MKKLLVLIVVLILTSCQKEEIELNKLNKIGCECNDGTKIKSLNPSDCSTPFTKTEQLLVKDSKGNPIYPPFYVTITTTLTHMGFKQFLYGKGTFCDNYGNSISCKPQGY